MFRDYRLGPLVWSAGLMLIGVLLTIFNFGYLDEYRSLAEVVLATGLAIAGIVAFVASATSPANWWRLIFAWTLFALAATVGIAKFQPSDRSMLAATLLIGLTIAFLHVYLLDRITHWWALVIGGFLFVVGSVLAVSVRGEGTALFGSLLLAGLGLVFFLLYLVSDKSHFWWAVIPGGALLTVALVTLTADLSPTNPLVRSWPLLLIVAGIFVGWRTSKPLPEQKMTVNQAPRMRSKMEKVSKRKATEAPVAFGEYVQPAPGASVEILVDPDAK